MGSLKAYGRISLITIAASLSMANFAYDAGVINSLTAIPSFQQTLNLDSTYIGLSVSIINIGAIAGCFISSSIFQRWGWTKGLMIANAIAIVGALIAAFSRNRDQLIAGRFLIGVSFLPAGTGAPSWVVEIAKDKHRAILSTAIIIGLPFAGIVASVIALCTSNYTSDWAWKGPLLGEVIPPLMSVIIIPFTVESPRWLSAHSRNEDAFASLVKLRGSETDPEVVREYTEMTARVALDMEVTQIESWKVVISPASNQRRSLIAVLAFSFMQLTSCNFVLYFANLILSQAGFSDENQLLKFGIGFCGWAAVSTTAGVFLIDRCGRRLMFLISTVIVILSLVLLAVMTKCNEDQPGRRWGIGTIIILFPFQFVSFAGWLPLAFIYPPEVLNYYQRAKTISVSQAIGYAFATMVSYIIPVAIKKISWKFYIINASWNVVILVVVWWLFIETKAKTTEEVNAIFEGVKPSLPHDPEEVDYKLEVLQVTKEHDIEDKSTPTGGFSREAGHNI